MAQQVVRRCNGSFDVLLQLSHVGRLAGAPILLNTRFPAAPLNSTSASCSALRLTLRPGTAVPGVPYLRLDARIRRPSAGLFCSQRSHPCRASAVILATVGRTLLCSLNVRGKPILNSATAAVQVTAQRLQAPVAPVPRAGPGVRGCSCCETRRSFTRWCAPSAETQPPAPSVGGLEYSGVVAQAALQ